MLLPAGVKGSSQLDAIRAAPADLPNASRPDQEGAPLYADGESDPAPARTPMKNPAVLPSEPMTSLLTRWGRASWFIVGIAAVAAISYSALAAVSGLVVPLVIAVVIGVPAAPLVDMLKRRRVPSCIGVLLVLVAIVLVIVGAAVVAVNGIIDQGDEISRQLTAALESVDSWLEEFNVYGGVAGDWIDQGKQFGVDLILGLAGWFTTAFSGVVSFLVSSFLCLFLRYYILVDWVRLRDWVGSHLGVPLDLGITVVGDATTVIRQGFAALTVSSLITAVIIGATMVALGVPLAFTVALVTFVTSYIPCLRAIFSATFACLVALGSAGVTEALILLVVILIVQNLVQTVVTTKLTSD